MTVWCAVYDIISEEDWDENHLKGKTPRRTRNKCRKALLLARQTAKIRYYDIRYVPTLEFGDVEARFSKVSEILPTAVWICAIIMRARKVPVQFHVSWNIAFGNW